MVGSWFILYSAPTRIVCFLSCYTKHQTKEKYPPFLLIQAIYGGIQLSRYALPVWSKGSCALLVPKHTQGATVNCQVYVTTIHILLQALFYRIHKKNNKVVAVSLYNVANIMPKRKIIFIHNLAYFRLKNHKKAGNRKIEPYF